MKKSVFIGFFALSLFLMNETLHAQLFAPSHYWRQYRTEIGGGFGFSSFLGDLGGADAEGKTYWIADADWPLVVKQPDLKLSYGYYLASKLVSRTSFSWMRLHGNDNQTLEPYRNWRDLNFRNDVFELSSVMELHFIKDKVRHRYKIKGVKGLKGWGIGMYVFGGISAFYHNPKGMYNGNWIPLAPLNTEGQGQMDGNGIMRPDYSNFSIAIPTGFGFRYSLNKHWTVGFEFAYRWTVSDYIDDVANNYVDPSEIIADDPAQNALARDMAEQGQGLHDLGKTEAEFIQEVEAFYENGEAYESSVKAGWERGDEHGNTDSWVTAMVTVNYKIKNQKRYGRRKRRRRPKKFKASF